MNGNLRPSNRAALACGLLLIVSAVLLFREVYTGALSILGIDSSYGLRAVLRRIHAQGASGAWIPSYWLGIGYGAFAIRTSYLFEAICRPETALAVSYNVSILLAMGFTYSLLRGWNLRSTAASLGAAAYSLTPHFVTLVYAGHTSVINFLPFLPGTFLFLTRALTEDSTPCGRTANALLAGVCWGMMMNEDPQRGLYGGIAAGAYVTWFVFARSDVTGLSAAVAEMRTRRFATRVTLTAVAVVVALLTALRGMQSQVDAGYLSGSRAGVSESGASHARQVWTFATGWSLHPAELVDSLAAGYHGWLSGHAERPYWGTKPVSHNSDSLGYFVVLWAAVGMLMGYRRHGVIRFMTWAAAAATLLACGKYLPGQPLFWLWLKLPLMDRFRVPLKFMAVTTFALAVLAAYGLDLYLTAVSENRARRHARVLLMTLGALLGVGVLWTAVVGLRLDAVGQEIAQSCFGGSSESGSRSAWNMVVALARMCGFTVLALALIWISTRPSLKTAFLKWGGAAAALLVVVDLYSIDRFYVVNSLFRPDAFFAPDGVTRFLQSDPDRFRVTTSLKLMYHGQMVPLSITSTGSRYLTYTFPYFDIEAMDNLPSGRIAPDYAEFFRAVLGDVQISGGPDVIERLIRSNLRLWKLGNVKYVITDGFLYGIGPQPVRIFEILKTMPFLDLAQIADGYQGVKHAVFRVKDVRPRSAFYSRFDTASNRADALGYLADPNTNPAQTPVLTALPSPVSTDESPGAIAVRWLRTTADITLTNAVPGLLVVSAKYDPAWEAIVDGQRETIRPVDYLLQGVTLAAGTHHVRFRYVPNQFAWRVSTLTLAGALAAAAALVLFARLRRC